ncbi:hypothetical protein BTW08_04040 [Salinicola sp. MH3R3-1]|uniref:hypothetical protein n=1 Tax=Salinicola sp. MH3R3-1 TaxID=1928762 RepID=UPI000967720E|nr:hypothetical protein [Salinicola sp. MH3R3-1]OLO09017.1 hypothetical protein BTW08_04040 [Salinicola sp. MH3R3-1]
MQSKYKSPGLQTLLAFTLLLALLTGWLAEDTVRMIAWLSGAIFALFLIRFSSPRLSRWFPVAVILLCGLLLATRHTEASLWLWLLPLCLSRMTGRIGMALNVAAYVLVVADIGWALPLPTAIVVSVSLAIVWLLCLERQRHSTATPPTTPEWLLPPAQLDADIQIELKRSEREILHSEVALYGCARSTTADMEQLCRCLRQQLAPYERAYRLNDYGVAVILIAPNAEAASLRRQQLRYAIAPQREISSTPLAEIGDRFTRYHSKPSTPVSEMQSWH